MVLVKWRRRRGRPGATAPCTSQCWRWSWHSGWRGEFPARARAGPVVSRVCSRQWCQLCAWRFDDL